LAEIFFEVDDNKNPIFKLPAALNGRRLEILSSEDVTHPVRGLVSGAAKFAMSFQQAIDALVESDFETRESASSSTPILVAFEKLCYSATEFFDLFTLDLAKALQLTPDKKARERFADYKGIVSKRRAIWATICNKIKHNNNVLVPYSKTYKSDGQSVRGYALYQPADMNKQFKNRLFHKNGEAFRSFDVSLNQLVHDILKCDNAAAKLISQLPDNAEQNLLVIPNVPFRIGDNLQTLLSRPVYAGDKEDVMFDGVAYIEQSLKLVRRQAIDRKGAGNEVSAIFLADEIVRHFEFE
jgi:hypothetical protein